MSEYNDTLFVDREVKLRGFERLLRPETRQAVMLIRAREDMGKTWLTLKMQRHCLSPAVDLPVVRINFRDPLDIGKITDYLSILRLLRDQINRPSFFSHLNDVINQVTEYRPTPVETSTQAKFAQELEAYFSLADLSRVARLLDVTWDNLPGTILADKAYELVLQCTRSGRMDALIATLNAQRDNVNWQERWSELQARPAPTLVEALQSRAHSPNSETLIVDRNLLLPPLGPAERTFVERLLTDAFFTCIADLIATRGQAIFLFDAYESAPEEAKWLLRQQLLPRLHEERLREMVVIVTGRETPDLSDLRLEHLLVSREPVGLEAFTEEHVRAFMASREVEEDPSIWTFQAAWTLSGGNPGLLARMADTVQAQLSTDDDFFKDG